jgi:plastocyanin
MTFLVLGLASLAVACSSDAKSSTLESRSVSAQLGGSTAVTLLPTSTAVVPTATPEPPPPTATPEPPPASPPPVVVSQPPAPSSPALVQAPAAVSPPPPIVPPPAPATGPATFNLVAKNLVYTQTSLTVRSGAQVTINLDNQDLSVAHDIGVTLPGLGHSVTCQGPCKGSISFTAPAPGIYNLFCSLHVDMKGTLTVTP